MLTFRRARGLAAVLPLAFLGIACRELPGPSGPGRVAPTAAALSMAPELPAMGQGEPLIPIRLARVRLFRLPGETPARAIVDTVLPFGDADTAKTFDVGLSLTMVNERFGLELSLLDDRSEVAYLGRDTVVAHAGRPPAPQPIRLVYAGADTAVGRIALAGTETTLLVGAATPVRATAFLRDGRATNARFGYLVRGTPAITVDATGVLRATAPVAPGTAWLVARIATGLTDSVPLRAIVPAASIAVSPGTARAIVAGTAAFTAVARDAAGAILMGHEVEWSSANPAIATIADGVATGRAVGSTFVTARAQQATATVRLIVSLRAVARVGTDAASLVIRAGESASIVASAYDALDAEIPDLDAEWSVDDPGIATVSAPAGRTGRAVLVKGVSAGATSLTVTVEGRTTRVPLTVGPPAVARVDVAPASQTLLVGEAVQLVVGVFDAAGAPLLDRDVTWRVVTAGLASIDGSGLVTALQPGRAEVVATVEGVSGLAEVFVRRAASLTIVPELQAVSTPGQSATFSVVVLDSAGVAIVAPPVTWQLTGPAQLTLLGAGSVRVTMTGSGNAILTARVGGLVATATMHAGLAPVPPR